MKNTSAAATRVHKVSTDENIRTSHFLLYLWAGASRARARENTSPFRGKEKAKKLNAAGIKPAALPSAVVQQKRNYNAWRNVCQIKGKKKAGYAGLFLPFDLLFAI
jgi:hypothetical protein